MSRSGYSDDCGGWDLIRWRGAVNSAIRGARGQALLREIATAMDAMTVRELIADEMQADGCFCTLGVVGAARGIDLSKIDIEDRESVAQVFGVATALAAEIMDVNDRATEWSCWEIRRQAKTLEDLARADKREREDRWRIVREWVEKHITKEPVCG